MNIVIKKLCNTVLLCLLVGYAVPCLTSCSLLWAGATGKSFFMPRPLTEDVVLEYAGSSRHHNGENPSRFTLTSTLFYSESVKGDGLAKYFFPNNKTELVIKGAGIPAVPGDRDISGSVLQIASKNTHDFGNPPFNNTFDSSLYLNEYQSTISIRPEMKSFGTVVNFNMPLHRFHKNLWLSVTLPFMQSETYLDLQEKNVSNNVQSRSQIKDFITTDGATDTRHEIPTLANPISALEAFNNPLWNFGKLKNGVQTRAGLADINVKIGGTAVATQTYGLTMYGQLTLPTGNKVDSIYMFEPMVGNGRHFGFGFGVDGYMTLTENNLFTVQTMMSLDYTYLIEGIEKRSLDLTTNGQWSRYLLVFEPTEPYIVKPGINFFTRDLKVTPASSVNMLVGMRFFAQNTFMQIGYNAWWKDGEKIKLDKSFNDQIAIAHLQYGIDAGAPGNFPFTIQSASTATIVNNINDSLADQTPVAIDGNPALAVLIDSKNFDLNSAARPAYLSHKFFLTTGYNGYWNDEHFQIAVGGSYELTRSNVRFDQWTAWIKFELNV